MLLSSCRGEAKLWDVGACRDRAEALWAPNETIGDSLRTFEGVRNAIFRPDGLLVQILPVSHIWPLHHEYDTLGSLRHVLRICLPIRRCHETMI